MRKLSRSFGSASVQSFDIASRSSCCYKKQASAPRQAQSQSSRPMLDYVFRPVMRDLSSTAESYPKVQSMSQEADLADGAPNEVPRKHRNREPSRISAITDCTSPLHFCLHRGRPLQCNPRFRIGVTKTPECGHEWTAAPLSHSRHHARRACGEIRRYPNPCEL